MLSSIGLGEDWRFRSQITSRTDVVSYRLVASHYKTGFRRPLIILIDFIKYPDHVRDRHPGQRTGAYNEHWVNIGGVQTLF